MWLCGLDFGDFLCDALQYLIFVFVVFLFEAHRVSIVLSLGVESVDDDLLGALNLGAAERTALKTREEQLSENVTASRCAIVYLSLGVDLPRSQTWRAQKMSTWLNSDVFIILGTYFTKLEGASCICVFDSERKNSI